MTPDASKRVLHTHSDEDTEMRLGLGKEEGQIQAKMLNMFKQYKTETLEQRNKDTEKVEQKKQEKEESLERRK